jgi:hypothetical protein
MMFGVPFFRPEPGRLPPVPGRFASPCPLGHGLDDLVGVDGFFINFSIKLIIVVAHHIPRVLWVAVPRSTMD